VFALDLASGQQAPLFQPPEKGWLTAASLSPEGEWLALAYAPPPAAGEVQLGYTSLYLLPGDCAGPGGACAPTDLTLLLERDNPHAAYFSPVWAPNGQTLYFAHFTPSDSETASTFKYTLERVQVVDGALAGSPEKVLDDALWPALSPDGSQMVYVHSDPVDFTNQLFVAAADGTGAVAITTREQFEAVDAPFFSRDGGQIFFSAVGEGPAGRRPAVLRWLAEVWQVPAAEADEGRRPPAHNVPSDWWRLPATGGAPERLTTVYDTGLFGDVSPDGAHVAYISASGLWVMAAGGGQPQKLSDLAGFGTLEWVP
jgi:Tol biopolymer transport system component